MAFTLSPVAGLTNKPQRVGQQLHAIVDVVISSYTTGGETLTPARLGMTKFYQVQADVEFTNGNKATFDYANNLLKLYSAGNTETSAAAARTVRIRAIGI